MTRAVEPRDTGPLAASAEPDASAEPEVSAEPDPSAEPEVSADPSAEPEASESATSGPVPVPDAPLVPATRLTLYDRWSSRVAGDPRLRRLWRWLAPTLVTLLAAVLRLSNLEHPHDIYFDETYYVKDAWSQWNLGYPATWPDGADDSFESGNTDVFTTVGSYVVHPPLGKWLIGLGMALFGPDPSFSWRISTALFGIATVLLLYAVALTLTRSIVFASVASSLLAIDGLAIVLSRIAILDVFVAFFALLTFWFVIFDRRAHNIRLAALLRRRSQEDPGAVAWGPVLWNRPWLLAAGASAGAMGAVKWSGLYVLAAVGVYLVVSDALARRRAGVEFWPVDALRQAFATFTLLVPVAVAVYLASWTGWLVTQGGYDRTLAASSPATGFWSWVPLPLQSLWLYHVSMYSFHVGLTTPHSAASPAWQWPLLLHPTAMFWVKTDGGQGGCAWADGCVEAVASTPNPLVWWASIAAAIYLVVRYARTRDWRYGIVLLGIGATYLPWLAYPDRTIFQFYTGAMQPFLLLALAYALRDVAGARHGPPERRVIGIRIIGVFFAVTVALAIFWYPVLTAMDVPYWFWHLHSWMPGW